MKLDYIHDEISSRKSQIVLRLVEINVGESVSNDIHPKDVKTSKVEESVQKSALHEHKVDKDDENLDDEVGAKDESIVSVESEAKSSKTMLDDKTDDNQDDDEEDECCCCNFCCPKKGCPRRKKKTVNGEKMKKKLKDSPIKEEQQTKNDVNEREGKKKKSKNKTK